MAGIDVPGTCIHLTRLLLQPLSILVRLCLRPAERRGGSAEELWVQGILLAGGARPVAALPPLEPLRYQSCSSRLWGARETCGRGAVACRHSRPPGGAPHAAAGLFGPREMLLSPCGERLRQEHHPSWLRLPGIVPSASVFLLVSHSDVSTSPQALPLFFILVKASSPFFKLLRS